ncbi:MAG: ABC transporter ATP-binding protein [Candidatus Thermoplasmatota archaeon]|nr:ABC transporter ATP-binding protein [Candidatus Thermoplasmatota archaeon]MED5487078.1 ABC transporter ATP-binding protein [Candidatus Thermoplasmatota archaeon]
MLELRSATFRYPVRRPQRFRPWATVLGQGIRNIDISLESGSVYGLVGPNGAGKSTLMQVLAGLIDLDQGEIELVGKKSPESIRESIGYMPERVSWGGSGTARHVMQRLCSMRGISSKSADELLNLTGLEQRADDEIRTYSQGMKQRLSLATTLLGDPNVLLLDEPLNGLDSVAQSALCILIKQLAAKGKCIVISSHNLSDLEKLADKFLLMHNGDLVAKGRLDEIERDLGIKPILEIGGVGPLPDIENTAIEVKEIPIFDGEEWAYRLHLDGQDWSTEMRQNLGSEINFTRLHRLPTRLETVISAATGVEIEDAGFSILSEVDSDD